MKFKGFISQSFDFEKIHGVGVTFKRGKNEWRHAVSVPSGSSPEDVARALMALAKAIQKASLPVSKWWQK